ncbi:MAG TPA: phosphoesterase PA-phosphatase, partial [Chitinophagaceae bacterium]|nr:phosphoesterase PA-phosphatase [Chitinophagaceae bacterium]
MFKYLCAVIATAACLGSCKNAPGDYSSYVSNPILYCNTVKQLNNVVLENNFPPMIASRNYVYANIAAYEVVTFFDSRFQSLAGQIKHLPALPAFDTNGVDYHLAALLAFCKVGEAVTFPEGSLQEYVSRLEKDADSAGVPVSVLKASQRFAGEVAAHILKWSKGDNYAQLRTAPKFTITTEEGRWVPTPPMYSQALEPHWNEIRCML